MKNTKMDQNKVHPVPGLPHALLGNCGYLVS